MLWGGLMASACGGEDATLVGPAELGLVAEGLGDPICYGFPRIEGLRAQARTGRGAPVPLPTGCFTESVSLSSLPPGRYEIRVEGRGPLMGQADAILYEGVREVELTASRQVRPAQMVLRPTVATLEVGWTTESPVANACAAGASSVGVRVRSTSGAHSDVEAEADCAAEGLQFDVPFPVGEVEVSLEARVAGVPGAVLSSRETRLLDPGANAVMLVLQPDGGELFLDWSFVAPEGSTRACDGFGVERLDLELRAMRNDGPEQTWLRSLDCAGGRPSLLPQVRIPGGADVELSARAPGATHVFRDRRTFQMPLEGDGEVRLQLVPHGDIEVRWTFSDACAVEAGPTVTLVDVLGRSVWSAEAATSPVVTPEVRYGGYTLSLTAPASDPACGASVAIEVEAPRTTVEVALSPRGE
jgi:hypothetical protein